MKTLHQYIVRETGGIAEEQLLADRIIRALYSPRLEHAGWLTGLASSQYVSELLGYLNYDNLLSSRASGMQRFLRRSGINLAELVDDLGKLNTPRKIFERQIKYWQFRPLPHEACCVVCPADSRVVTGSISTTPAVPIKEKFFTFPELLGQSESQEPTSRFWGGDYAVFRLTPEKYHYTHVPVTGVVEEFYAVEGRYHSCNPNATVHLLTPHSKNRRVVTILNSDCPGGSGVGRVAMIEVVALMVGQIEQRYSQVEYQAPRMVERGMLLQIGAPKALFRPGSSTVVLLFEAGRIRFAEDLVGNQRRRGIHSRYSAGFGEVLVETDVAVRSLLATSRGRRS